MSDQRKFALEGGLEAEFVESAVPQRPRLPVVSLSVTVLFLVLGGLLLYFVRAEIAYFFAGRSPAVRFVPSPERPVPPNAPSNVLAEARIDHTKLCDYWDDQENPLAPEQSYAFTLQMGFGKRYYFTCVGDGSVRPRLWIFRPETVEESQAIYLEAKLRRQGRTLLDTWTEAPIPEIHIPGGSGCVYDLCRGRLIRFGQYAQNPLGGVRKIQSVLLERLEAEFRRFGRPPLEDSDYLLILDEHPSSRWWYVVMLGGILILTVANLYLAVRSLRAFFHARSVMEHYLRYVRTVGGIDRG